MTKQRCFAESSAGSTRGENHQDARVRRAATRPKRSWLATSSIGHQGFRPLQDELDGLPSVNLRKGTKPRVRWTGRSFWSDHRVAPASPRSAALLVSVAELVAALKALDTHIVRAELAPG